MMNGFPAYFLNTLDPTSVLAFVRMLPTLIFSAGGQYWFVVIFVIVRSFVPTLACWIISLVAPSIIRPKSLVINKQAPLVSIVIAGRNEAASIGTTIHAAMLCGYPNLELIFVDDGSDDESISVARNAARSLGLHNSGKIRILSSPRRNGKASALNIGISVTRGEFIAIIDADTEIQNGAMEYWLLPFADPQVGAVAGNVRVRNSNASFLTRLQECEYAAQATIARLATSQINLLNMIPGAAGLFRADALRQMGGYDTGLGDDTDMTLRLRKHRWKLAFALDAVVWDKVPTNLARLLRQRARWERNMVRIRLRKHGDMFILGRYGLANAALVVDFLIMRLLLPWLSIFGMFYIAFVYGPLSAPVVLTDLYFLAVFLALVKAAMSRDIADTPDIRHFWCLLLFPIYKSILRFVVMGAAAKELFRIGVKHPYVPDHVWAETYRW